MRRLAVGQVPVEVVESLVVDATATRGDVLELGENGRVRAFVRLGTEKRRECRRRG
jgi:hypothetical protein